MSHSFCVNLTHFELMSHSSELTNFDRSVCISLKESDETDERTP